MLGDGTLGTVATICPAVGSNFLAVEGETALLAVDYLFVPAPPLASTSIGAVGTYPTVSGGAGREQWSAKCHSIMRIWVLLLCWQTEHRWGLSDVALS